MFQLEKYLGCWYQQYHIPQWFNVEGGSDISAHYSLNPNGTVTICNKTLLGDRIISVYGTLQLVSERSFTISFGGREETTVNYIIQHLLVDDNDNYVASIVTNVEGTSLFVLTRQKHIPCTLQLLLLQKIAANWDLSKVESVRHH